MRRSERLAITVVVVLVAASCVGRDGPSRTTLPNPFTIIARYPPRSLGLRHVLALTVGPDGNLYVTDASQQVAVVSPDGQVLEHWGQPGSGQGEFRFVSGDPNDRFDVHAKIAVAPDGRVYVADPGNHRIQVFTSGGSYAGVVGRFGRDDGEFLDPVGLAVDQAGSLFVSDDVSNTVTKFSPDGDFRWRVGGPSTDFIDPHLGNVDVHGRLVVIDGPGVVLYVDGAGQVVDSFDGGGCEATVDALGYTYVNLDVSDCSAGLTRVFDRAHHLVGEWSGAGDTLEGPIRLAADREAFALGADGSILRLQVSLPDD